MSKYVIIKMDESLIGEAVNLWIEENKPAAITFQKVEGSTSQVYCEIRNKPESEFLIKKIATAIAATPISSALPPHVVDSELFNIDQQRMALLIDDSMAILILYYWLQNGKATPVTMQCAKSGKHLVGVTFTVDSKKAYDFYVIGASKTGAKVQNITKD